MERDLAAIQAKLDSLEKEAEAINKDHSEEADVVRARIAQIKVFWEQLTQMVNKNPLDTYKRTISNKLNLIFLFSFSSKSEMQNWKKPVIFIASYVILIISKLGLKKFRRMSLQKIFRRHYPKLKNYSISIKALEKKSITIGKIMQK